MAMYQVDINDVVRNYDLGDSEGFLFCLFEAVSNALYCCVKNQDIRITIRFTREYKANELTRDNDNFITAFSVTDNGTGFTNDNFDKFTNKIYKTNHEGGKGLGRVAFLKVFNNVYIESYFKENGKYYSRNFKFGTGDIKDTKKEAANKGKQETTVYFKNIRSNFRDDTKKVAEYYLDEILNHFYIFLYFLLEQNKKFEIKIIDDSGKISEEIINTEKLKADKVKKDSFIIHDPSAFEGVGTVTFDILHIKTRNIKGNKAFYVVDERSAGEIKKLDIPQCLFKDSAGNKFYYYVYLKSGFFNRFLNESRTKLSIPAEGKKSEKKLITEEVILRRLQEKIDTFLEYELSVLEKETEKRIDTILTDDKNNRTVNNKSYLYILADGETKKELLNKIKFNDTENDVINKIRNFHEELQIKTVEQINIVVEKLKSDKKTKNAEIDYAKLEADFQSLAKKINIENSVNLSSYIMYRKYVLDLFCEGLEYYKNSKEFNESFFHNILMQKGSHNTVDSNLWMLDDLFLFFEGTSEQPIQDIEINGQKAIRNLTEEEILMLNEFDKKRLEKRIDLLFFPEEKQCIIIELKDPKVGITEGVSQMDKYAQLLANFIRQEFSIDFFYTYLITDNFNKYDRPGGFRKIYGIDGFVRHSTDINNFDTGMIIANQYSEVIRYTDIYERAHKRNKIFMQKLNIQEESHDRQ
ncbi:hypothetical protein AGMMS50255_0980 [Spirochaetia bacterium]|nr:hypothetical protein AGMMS50255_0980 [Spirochaetia bacterium]